MIEVVMQSSAERTISSINDAATTGYHYGKYTKRDPYLTPNTKPIWGRLQT